MGVSGILRRALIVWLLPVVVLVLCLFGDSPNVQNSGAVGTYVREINLVFRDPETQWGVFLSLGVYIVMFTMLENHRRGVRFWSCSNASLFLAAALCIVTFEYAFNYSAASESTQALMLLAGVTAGQAARVWSGWGFVEGVTPCAPIAEDGGQRTTRATRINAVLFILIVLLALACLWQGESFQSFQYRGRARWNGPWENPNTFGVLMAVGLVLAAGQLVSGVSNAERGVRSGECGTQKAESRNWRAEIWHWIRVVLFATAAVVCGIGLVKSYSRGAWVATAVGLAYLGYQAFNRQIRGIHEQEQSAYVADVSRGSCVSRFMNSLRRNWIPLVAVFVSLAVLAFWNYRDTEHAIARRAFSVGNVNDFSWRNRLAACEGALQMMADKPWLGFGWNQPERVYDQYYRSFQVDEGMAIQVNDYFMLGTTLGIPALACFVMYVGLSLMRSAECRRSTSPRTLTPSPSPIGWARVASDSPQGGEGDLSPLSRHLSPSVLCRAGAIVLLVGFWFDGGLFKLATAATFWVLLELGKEN